MIHPTSAPFLASIAPANSRHKLPSFETTIGDLDVTVVYEYTPAEKPVYDVDSPVCGPGHDAEVDIIEVWLGNHDLFDVLSEDVIAELQEKALMRVTA